MNRLRLIAILIVLTLLLAAARIGGLLAHQPLLATANSFDQARYTGCFDLYPLRSALIRPDENSPQAPFEHYAYQRNPVSLCYASSELLMQALANGIYRVEESTLGRSQHSVRWIGGLRLLALLLIAVALCRAWWRRGMPAMAFGNAAVLWLVLGDPANTLYFNTYYAEATALMAAWAVLNLCVLSWGEARSRSMVLLLATAAFLLATSKIQHLLLACVLAATMLLFGYIHNRRWAWQGGALMIGGLLGAVLQFSQLARTDVMMVSIRSFNRADLVFTGLLPAVTDPVATLQTLGMPAACAAYAGKAAWQLPGLAEEVCPGIERLGRLDVLLALAREPAALMRFAASGVGALNSWLPRNLGLVEGVVMGRLPDSVATLGRGLNAHAGLRFTVFAAPLLAGLLVLSRRRNGLFALYTLLTCALMLATFAVTLLGDGLADVAKQGHLIFNAALAWCLVATILLPPWLWLRYRPATSNQQKK